MSKNTERAERHNAGKLQWTIVDFDSLASLVQALEYGAKKYAPDNWKKGMPVNEILDCAFRHLIAFKQGETFDSESGVSHIGHAMANLMFIQYMLDNKPELDNRPKQDTV